MRDEDTTVLALKEATRDMCREKGWGDNGEQNPQNVAMAMTVEMAELLEHFQWLRPEEVRALWEGRDSERKMKIAEEFADVMLYGLQLAYVLDFDISAEIGKKIARVLRRPESYYDEKRAMRDAFEENLR